MQNYMTIIINAIKSWVNGKINKLEKDLNSKVEEVSEQASNAIDAINEIPQADWNQSDETAKDYVKNRTHYDDSKTFFNLEDYNGDYSSLESVETEGPAHYAEGVTYYKVSEVDGIDLSCSFDIEFFVNNIEKDKVNNLKPNENFTQSFPALTYGIQREDYPCGTSMLLSVIRSASHVNTSLIIALEDGSSFNVEGTEVTLPKGIWVRNINVRPVFTSLTVNDLKQLDQKYTPNADWSQSDPNGEGYIKNRTHYEEENLIDIAGLEYEIEINKDTAFYKFSLPLELGQKWNIWYDSMDGNGEIILRHENLEVQVTPDDELGIYSSESNPLPFDLLGKNLFFDNTFLNMIKPTIFKVVGVSGYITGDPIVHKIDQKYVPNADWSQSNPNDEGYIKNRTHYDDIVYTLKDKNEISDFLRDLGYDPQLFQEDVTSPKPIEGLTFRVVIDGQVYDEVPVYTGCYYAGGYTYGIGDYCRSSNWPAGTNYGFCCTAYGCMPNPDFFPNGIESIEVYAVEKDFKYLDSKFIKDMYYDATQVLLNRTFTNDGTNMFIYAYDGSATEYIDIVENYDTVTLEVNGQKFTLYSQDAFDGFNILYSDLSDTTPQGKYSILLNYLGGTGGHKVQFHPEKLGLDNSVDSYDVKILFEDVHQIHPKYIKDMYYEKTEEKLISEGTFKDVTETEYHYWPNSSGSLEHLETWKVGTLPYGGYIVGDEYTVIFNGVSYKLTLNTKWDMFNAGYYIGFGFVEDEESTLDPISDGSAPFVGYFYDLEAGADEIKDKLPGMTRFGEVEFYVLKTSEEFPETTIQIYHGDRELKQIHPKYIKDMYHEEIKEIFNVKDAEFSYGEYLPESPFVLTEGNTYIVNWDGVESVCEAITFEPGVIGFYDSSLHFEIFYIGPIESCGIRSYGNNDGESSTHTISIKEKVIHTIQPKYIKDMYYDTGKTITELVPLQIVSEFTLMEEPIYVVENPFELKLIEGATYIVNWDGIEYELTCEVFLGTPYIGNFNLLNMQPGGDVPFGIAANEAEGMVMVATESTEESHEIGIIEIKHDMKQLDIKYLPILEEEYETVFEIEGFTGGEILDESYKKLVGEYRVTVDGKSEIAEFIDNFDFSIYICGNFEIETWDGGIHFWFSEDREHSIKIEEIK